MWSGWREKTFSSLKVSQMLNWTWSLHVIQSRSDKIRDSFYEDLVWRGLDGGQWNLHFFVFWSTIKVSQIWNHFLKEVWSVHVVQVWRVQWSGSRKTVKLPFSDFTKRIKTAFKVSMLVQSTMAVLRGGKGGSAPVIVRLDPHLAPLMGANIFVRQNKN